MFLETIAVFLFMWQKLISEADNILSKGKVEAISQVPITKIPPGCIKNLVIIRKHLEGFKLRIPIPAYLWELALL